MTIKGLLAYRGLANKHLPFIDIVGYHPPFPHNELVHLLYIAVATNTNSLEGEESLLITEANTIVGLYPYSVFTNPMFWSTNSLSIVNNFSCEYNSLSSHIVVCFLFNKTSIHKPERNRYRHCWLKIDAFISRRKNLLNKLL